MLYNNYPQLQYSAVPHAARSNAATAINVNIFTLFILRPILTAMQI